MVVGQAARPEQASAPGSNLTISVFIRPAYMPEFRPVGVLTASPNRLFQWVIAQIMVAQLAVVWARFPHLYSRR